MAISLRVTDNANGTGATAVVAGGSGSLWVERATVTASAIGSYAQVGGTLTDSGTVSPTGLGYYAWRVVNSGGALTDGVVQQTTAAGGSVWERCGIATQDRITSLALPGSPEILDGIWPNAVTKRDDFYICVSQTNQTPRVDFDGGMEEDDAEWPVLIQIVERIQPDGTTTKGRFLHAHERICQSLSEPTKWDKRLPEMIRVRVMPQETIDKDATALNKLRFAQIVAVFVCEFNRFNGVFVEGTS